MMLIHSVSISFIGVVIMGGHIGIPSMCVHRYIVIDISYTVYLHRIIRESLVAVVVVVISKVTHNNEGDSRRSES